MRVDGLHHVTAITADVRTNLGFYGRLLGLRLVWQGVNADDPSVRHIAYGDEFGSPGSIITFFDMPGVARGRPGAGMLYRLSLRVSSAESLDFWQRRLAGADVASKRLPEGLLFSDPDGLELELVVDDGEDEPLTATASDIDPSLAIRGIDSVRAYKGESAEASQDLVDVLGMTVDEERGLLTRGDHRHGWVIFDNVPDGSGAIGAGSFHHAAFTIGDGDEEEWRERLAAVAARPTEVLDRLMFKSIYFREPCGVLLELATNGPGFVFESADSLGEALVLVGDLEARRKELERRFPLLRNPRTLDVAD